MKIEITKNEAERILLAFDYLQGCFDLDILEVKLVRRLFKRWPKLKENWDLSSLWQSVSTKRDNSAIIMGNE